MPAGENQNTPEYLLQTVFDWTWAEDDKSHLHHHNDLNDIYPVWVIVEVLSFDQISMMYKNLLPTDRAAIAREFYGIPSRKYIENWTHCAVVARNIAAHGARFYHRPRINPPAKLPKSINDYGTKPFGFIYATAHPCADAEILKAHLATWHDSMGPQSFCCLGIQ